MRFIAISFTLKGQSFEDIKLVLERISLMHGATTGQVCLVHGFMPREAVVEKGFSTDVVDTLSKLFPYQLNLYKDGPQRELMAQVIKEQKAIVYSVGDVKEGVAEEMALYETATRYVCRLPLGWDGVMNTCSPPPTEGEYRVRLNFNVTENSVVDKIKRAGADFIDLIDSIKIDRELNQKDSQSLGRLKSLAMTEAEHATSDAVKAATV